MISFRLSTINQIKAASNEAEVAKIIEDSLRRLKMKKVHGHLIQRFIESMDLALSRERIEQHAARTMQNVTSAIDILRRMQKSKA